MKPFGGEVRTQERVCMEDEEISFETLAFTIAKNIFLLKADLVISLEAKIVGLKSCISP